MSKYDRIMKKCNHFYDNPKVEETWCLYPSISRYLVPRLKLFLKESSKIVNWDYHKETHNVDIPRKIRKIILMLEYVDKHSDTFDRRIADKCQYYIDESFKLLGEIYFYLWW